MGAGLLKQPGSPVSRKQSSAPSSHLGLMLTGDMAQLPAAATSLLQGGPLASRGGAHGQRAFIRHHLSPAAV